MTLVDAKDKRVYYYTTTGEEANNGNVLIALSSFVDSEGNPYQEPSISELIQAKASDQGGNKLFIKVGENGKPENAKDEDGRKYPEPTVRIKMKLRVNMNTIVWRFRVRQQHIQLQ